MIQHTFIAIRLKVVMDVNWKTLHTKKAIDISDFIGKMANQMILSGDLKRLCHIEIVLCERKLNEGDG